jgi:hypothetical protein
LGLARMYYNSYDFEDLFVPYICNKCKGQVLHSRKTIEEHILRWDPMSPEDVNISFSSNGARQDTSSSNNLEVKAKASNCGCITF